MRLSELTRALVAAGIEEASVEARMLFSKLGGFSTAALLASDPALDTPTLAEALRRRTAGEPLAYILGETAFYNELYTVTPAVLIPRSDTEILVEHAVAKLPRGAFFADLCTGSGCIAISILANRPDCTAVALDLSEDALLVAKGNAERNCVSDRITLMRQDVLTPFALPSCDAILSNPPYIPSKTVPTLSREVAREPHTALDGGEDGLLFYRTMLTYLPACLKEGGFLLFEIGYDQEEAILRLASDASMTCEVKRDYGGNPRMAILRRV